MGEPSRRNLLAEDDRFLRKAAETGLKRQGFTLLAADAGEEAVRMARAAAPDLILPELALAERGRIPVAFLLAQLAQAWDVGFIELKVGDVQLDALQTVREEYARSHGVVPFQREDRTLKVAMANPRDKLIVREMAQMTKCEIVPYLSPEGNIRRAQLLYKGNLRDMLERSALHASTAINPPAKTAAAPAGPGGHWHAAGPAARW